MNARSGQAMIEFLTGLILVMMLVLAMELVAVVGAKDFKTMFAARSAVSEVWLGNEPEEDWGDEVNPYQVDTALEKLAVAIDPDNSYTDWLETYPSGMSDGFGRLWSNQDMFEEDLVSRTETETVDVGSPFFQEVIGRTEIVVSNQVWMPPWDDFME